MILPDTVPHNERDRTTADAMALVADARDVLTGRTYRVWLERPVRRTSRWRPRRQRSFVVEADGTRVATLHEWREVVEWHDRNVISQGLRIVDEARAR